MIPSEKKYVKVDYIKNDKEFLNYYLGKRRNKKNEINYKMIINYINKELEQGTCDLLGMWQQRRNFNI